jgi:hypothetical protein
MLSNVFKSCSAAASRKRCAHPFETPSSQHRSTCPPYIKQVTFYYLPIRHFLITNKSPLPTSHFPSSCYMSHQSNPESSSLTTLFDSALQQYAKQTGKPWADHPLAKELEQCHSLESISDVIQKQAQAFTRSRGGDSRIVKSLKSAIPVLYTLSTNSTLTGAISAVRRTR